MSVDGARVLFAITNDAWYGRTGAPYQFLAMTAVRAAENGLPVVRAANSGISAVIDSRGKVVHQSEIYVQDVVVGDISLSPADAPLTFYARNGDVFAWLCWAFVLVIAFVPRFRAEPTRAV
jgi:apolipoprotein N-acyltransferase